MRIILADKDAALALDLDRCLPWLVNVLGRHVFELREPFANVIAIPARVKVRLPQQSTGGPPGYTADHVAVKYVRICLFAKGHGRITPKVLIKVCRARQPLPIEVVDAPIGIHQVFFKDGRPRLPGLPQVAARQETGHHVTGQMMDPARLFQLRHDGVDKGKTRLGGLPLFEPLWIVVPRNWTGDGIARHAIKVRSRIAHQVVVLAPHELAVQGNWGFGQVFRVEFCVDFGEGVIKSARGQATVLDIWRSA